MANAGYIASNLIATTTTAAVSVSTEDAVYTRAHLSDRLCAYPFRFTTYGGWIEVDAGVGVTLAPNAIALINHNLSAAATVTLKGGATSNPSTVTHSLTWRQYDLFATWTPATAYRYWRLAITEPDTTITTQIGELVLGTLVTLTAQFSYGHEEAIQRDTADLTTERGVTWPVTRTTRATWSLTYTNQTTAQIAELAALDLAVSGGRFPFLWVPDVSLAPCYYVRKGSEHRTRSVTSSIWSGELRLTEESRGLEILR